MSNQLTAQQRAQLFAMSTRQNLQMLAKETATSTPSTLTFTLPKARLLAGLMVRVKGTMVLTDPNGVDYNVSDPFQIYKAIRRISLDLNNGFAPFVLSGVECAMYNMIDVHPALVEPSRDAGAYTRVPATFSSSADGAATEFEFTLNLPCTTNPRDPIGLILLQNDQTNVVLTVDLGTGAEIIGDATYTAELKNVSVMPMLETFSVPANANAYPDLSVLKLTNGRKDSMPSSGQQIIKLTTGTIYRKLIFRVLDENDEPVDADWINSNIELVFNQADINYSVNPEMLRVQNHKQLGYLLPKGMFVFDFSNGGAFPNLGGTRDFIDSANLTEFWLRFNTTGKGKVEIVTETLARLA